MRTFLVAWAVSGMVIAPIFQASEARAAFAQNDDASASAPSPRQGVSPPRAKKNPSQGKDNCAALRKPFRDVRDHAVNSALTGALLGGLAGLFIGGVTGQSGNKLVGTALTGAAAGGALGWIQAKREQGMQEAELQAALNQEMSPEVTTYSRLAGQLADLGNCRRTQLYQVKVDFLADQFNHEEAVARADRIMSWVRDDDALVAQAARVQSERVGYFAQAYGYAEGRSQSEVGDGTGVLTRLNDRRNDPYAPKVELVGLEENEPARAQLSHQPPSDDGSGGVTWYAKMAAGARVHSSPASVETIGLVRFGGSISIAGVAPANPNWIKVNWHGEDGYIRADQMSAQPPGTLAGSRGRRTQHQHVEVHAAAIAVTAPAVVAKPPPHQGPILIHVTAATPTPADTVQNLRAGASSSHAVAMVIAKNGKATNQEYQNVINANHEA
jgi:uncharacterized protein YcfJ